MNKKFLMILMVVLSITSIAKAQKYAYIDSEYILSKIPEHQAAQQQLDNLSVQWQKEIEAKYAEIDKLYKAYQAEQILLTEELKRKRENEIINKEKEAKELQKQRFGVDGELFKKRQELIKPIQDKIYTAVKDIAVKENLAVVFDKAGSLSMMYTNPKFDKSDAVLEALGYKSTK
ncbi:MAG: OmpH family outer membrane protein [Bacteroidia bacterium]